jgi:hypothetical protein
MPAGDPEYDRLFDQHQKWWKSHGWLWRKEAGALLWEPGPHDRGLPTLGPYADLGSALKADMPGGRASDPKGRLASTIATGWPGLAWVFAHDVSGYDALVDTPPTEYPEEALKHMFQAFHGPPWAGSPTSVGVCFPEGFSVTEAMIDEAARVPNLRGLSLAGADASPDLLPRIARIKSLEHLGLGAMRLTDAGLRALAPLKKLRTLIAPVASLTGTGAATLRRFSELRELRLGNRRLAAAGYQAIAKLPKLEVLQLQNADDAAVRHLAPLTRLRRLYLDDTGVTGRGLERLPLLTHLGVSRTPFGDAGMAAVAELPRLRELNVTGTDITGAGLAHLRGLRWLEELYVVETGLRDRDLVHLEPLKRLRTIAIWDTDVTKKGVAALRKTFRSATIHA